MKMLGELIGIVVLFVATCVMFAVLSDVGHLVLQFASEHSPVVPR